MQTINCALGDFLLKIQNNPIQDIIAIFIFSYEESTRIYKIDRLFILWDTFFRIQLDFSASAILEVKGVEGTFVSRFSVFS